MIIDPHLECWWSHKRLTHIGVDGSGFSGGGVSLRVLLPAFSDTNLVWFSAVYGEFNDNVLLLAMNRATPESYTQIKHRTTSPIMASWGQKPGFEEYVLTDEVKSRLGVSFGGKNLLIGRLDLVRYQVYIHDDCFFFIDPINNGLLKKLVHCILRQHSFYLGKDVDWSEVLDSITERVMSSSKRVEIQSDPKRLCLMFPQDRDKSIIRRLLNPGAACGVIIREGKANLANSQSK